MFGKVGPSLIGNAAVCQSAIKRLTDPAERGVALTLFIEAINLSSQKLLRFSRPTRRRYLWDAALPLLLLESRRCSRAGCRPRSKSRFGYGPLFPAGIRTERWFKNRALRTSA